MNDMAPNKLFVWGFADMKSGKHQVRIRESIQAEGNMFDLAQDPTMTVPDDSIWSADFLLSISGNAVL